jgi:hypothetical protein
MNGSLFQAARNDAATIASSGGFSVTATLTTPDNSVSLPVTGLGTGTWIAFDDLRSGKVVNSTSNSFNISVNQLIAGSYPYKQINGMVNLVGHKIVVIDETGSMGGTFTITEQHPNATFGLIICILGRQS